MVRERLFLLGLPVGLLVSGIVIVGEAARVPDLVALEGIWGTTDHVLSLGGDSDFAPAYSDSAFRAVNVGAREAAVVAALGPPLETYTAPNDEAAWTMGMRWSRSRHSGSYSVRYILFKDGLVVRRVSEWYVD